VNPTMVFDNPIKFSLPQPTMGEETLGGNPLAYRRDARGMGGAPRAPGAAPDNRGQARTRTAKKGADDLTHVGGCGGEIGRRHSFANVGQVGYENHPSERPLHIELPEGKERIGRRSCSVQIR